MTRMHLLGFIGSILFVFVSFSTYLFIRGFQAIPDQRAIRIGYTCVFLALTILPWLSRTLPEPLSGTLLPVGYTWVIAAVYLTLFALTLDLIRIMNFAVPFYPEWVQIHYTTVKWALLLSGIALISILLVWGNRQFAYPVVARYDIALDKPLSKSVHIVAISDLHLGKNIGEDRLEKWVQQINQLHPDLVVIAGDITDQGADAEMVHELSPVLRQIQSRYGVFSIPGNHDQYGRQSVSMDDFMKASGIRYLRDSIVCVDKLMYIVGRDDNRRRKALGSLLHDRNTALPVLLLDHRPDRLEEARSLGIDLQISGHTHQGQFWPVSLIVKRMFPLSHGYMRQGKTQFIVSSGLGLWGPQYRIGTQSEIVSIQLTGLPKL